MEKPDENNIEKNGIANNNANGETGSTENKSPSSAKPKQPQRKKRRRGCRGSRGKKTREPYDNSEGIEGSGITKADLQLYGRAIRGRWAIPDEKRQEIVAKQIKIALGRYSRHANIAVRNLLAMDRLNLMEYIKFNQTEVNVNVGVGINGVESRPILSAEERDAELTKLVDALREQERYFAAQAAIEASGNPLLPTQPTP